MSGVRRFRPLGCEEVDELAAEFALGLLDGAERAAVVAHLDGCRRCGAQVADLAEAGEQMLVVSPVVEPPVGFEERVLGRLARVAPPVAPRRRRWLGTALAIAAAAALVLGTAGLVLRVTGGGDRTDEAAIEATRPPLPEQSATLLSVRHSRDVGDAVVVEDDPMVVELDMVDWMADIAGWDEPPTGPWQLHVIREGGGHENHPVALEDDATPRVALEAGGQPVETVWITDGAGEIWCSAQFGQL